MSHSSTAIEAAAILIVGGDQQAVGSPGRVLASVGRTDVECVESLSGASAHLCRQKFGLVILDLSTAFGLEPLQQLTGIECFQDVPVLTVVPDLDRQAGSDAVRAGAADFAMKPLDPVVFPKRVSNLLSGWAARRTPSRPCTGRHADGAAHDPVGADTVLPGGELLSGRDLAEHVRYLMTHDVVSELPNRFAFLERFDRILDRAVPGERHAALIIDLDQFKIVNESLGHTVGDDLIRQVARRLEPLVGADDILAHLGADDFAVVLHDVSSDDAAAAFADKVARVLAEPFLLRGQPTILSASIGIAMAPEDGRTAEELVRLAEIALYRAKAVGRNAYRFFHAAMNEEVRDRQALSGLLREALAKDAFALQYQPQIDIATGRIIGAEALMRWHHPDHGWISPARFIPVAESSGLIVPLGEWCLRHACAQNKAWQDAGLPEIKMAVNLSAVEFADPDLVGRVDRVLSETRLSADALEIEITEGIAMDHNPASVATLNGLRDLGVELAIDDFGTGYSSLAYLKTYPVNTIKIDQTFVREIRPDSRSGQIADATIRLGQSLEKRVVAEGVETDYQLNFLHKRRCDFAQGFFISRPLTPDAFAAFLDERAGAGGTGDTLAAQAATCIRAVGAA